MQQRPLIHEPIRNPFGQSFYLKEPSLPFCSWPILSNIGCFGLEQSGLFEMKISTNTIPVMEIQGIDT
jgi:hypothetical protein